MVSSGSSGASWIPVRVGYLQGAYATDRVCHGPVGLERWGGAQPWGVQSRDGIKMSAEESSQLIEAGNGVNLEAVQRISKLPIVESTIETATNIYTKVKDYNSVTNWTLATAESTAHKAVEIAKPYAAPLVTQLKEPIQKVDGLLCSGLDYVEEKIPAVKLPPGELFLQMYTGAKDIVTNTVGSGVETAKHMVEPAVETVKHQVEAAKHMVEPAIETAKHYVEPAVETAKHYIDPAVETAKHYIDPAMEKACAIKDYGVQQVDKFLHPNAEKDMECEECKNQNEQPKETKNENVVDM
ncbi:hypothetical protein Trydic_g23369 [Trypoxylus dichotomus]